MEHLFAHDLVDHERDEGMERGELSRHSHDAVAIATRAAAFAHRALAAEN